ncbi:MAG: hypothetical protein KME19_18075 [Microcoleus vaginatus WJT46-NPBG5]|jgi:hypothetical protein|nr:hypothetical protein [Microcoleus vaginatus WJT46-NPBG5]
MSHFSLKSLSFYGIAIGSVAVLFNLVSAYGEKNLKAPPAIAGRYLIPTKNVPGCKNPQGVVLTLNQSGIYLNGFLSPADRQTQSAEIAEEKPSLEGKFEQKKLNLLGVVGQSKLCKELDNKAPSTQFVKITGEIEGEKLKGQMRLSSTPKPIEFTAKREAPVKRQETH